MTDQQSSYRQILKATSLFGGVQVFKIIITIVKSKFVAVLLGPTGIGISGLLTSTLGLVTSFTYFGLSTSAVTDVSAANATQDDKKISAVIIALKRLVWITGLLGTIITLCLSKYLSQLTFGNSEYTYAFIWLSCTLLFAQLSVGQNVVLQGMRKLQYLAKANIIGSLLGLFTSVPLFYFLGIKGIVPSLIVSSVSALLISWYYSNKVEILPQRQSLNETIKVGKGMMVMGLMLSLTGVFNIGVSYIIRVFIAREGGIADVGLYNAGFAIVGTYVGLIFSAMDTDYYPRLAAVAYDNDLVKKTVNQQAEIAILILAPILMVFLVFVNWIVVIFYSHKFLGINNMIQWAALGVFFKAASWCISFVFLAKSASKLFFVNELIAQAYILVFNIVAFKYLGLEGLGISSLFIYIFYLIQVFLIAKKKYAFTFTMSFYKVFGFQFLLAVSCLLIMRFINSPYSYFLGGIIVLISCYFSFNDLNRYMGLKELLTNSINKYFRKD